MAIFPSTSLYPIARFSDTYLHWTSLTFLPLQIFSWISSFSCHLPNALPNDLLSILSFPNTSHTSLLLAILSLISYYSCFLAYFPEQLSFPATYHISLSLTIFRSNCDFPWCNEIVYFLPLATFSCHFPFLTITCQIFFTLHTSRWNYTNYFHLLYHRGSQTFVPIAWFSDTYP